MSSRRTEIATVAARVIAAEGIARTSLRGIASEMGVTIGTLTHHFRDRDDLLRTAFEVSVREARERAEQSAAGLDGVPLVAALLAEALPTNEDRRVEAAVWLAFSLSAVTNLDHAAMCGRLYEEFEGALAEALCGAGVSAGAARDRARLLIAAADGIALRALTVPALDAPQQERLLGQAIAGALGTP
ncbi:MAG TPA: TetR/AcrR family transcriptional regulator [Candidatus Limnocylindrales bacterium]|nr:TetR/AcrR family transcriptional regulator [Candidatus Limnocylindrales bacterium]